MKNFSEEHDNKPLSQILDLNTLPDLNYVGWCVSEGLRIEAPVPVSSPMSMTETTRVNEYTLRAGDILCIDMYRLQRNKDEWIDPEEFIPERFDPKSRYFLTPSG